MYHTFRSVEWCEICKSIHVKSRQWETLTTKSNFNISERSFFELRPSALPNQVHDGRKHRIPDKAIVDITKNIIIIVIMFSSFCTFSTCSVVGFIFIFRTLWFPCAVLRSSLNSIRLFKCVPWLRLTWIGNSDRLTLNLVWYQATLIPVHVVGHPFPSLSECNGCILQYLLYIYPVEPARNFTFCGVSFDDVSPAQVKRLYWSCTKMELLNIGIL